MSKKKERVPNERDSLFPLGLMAKAQAFDQLLVAVEILSAQVAQKLAALADKGQKALLGMVVVDVHAQVIGQIADPLRENGDLHFGRAGIGGMHAILLDELGFD